MATIDDVEVALQQAAARALFPGTAYAAGAVANASVPSSGFPGAGTFTAPVRLYVGAPAEDELTKDIQAGVSNVCIFREKGMSRNTTRFAPYRKRLTDYQPTLTLAQVTGGFVVGGAAGVAQIMAALVNGTWYTYAAAATDGPSAVATAMAAEIPGATASGAMVTVANVQNLRTGVYQREIEITGTFEEVVNVALLAVATSTQTGPIVREGLGRALDGLRSLTDERGEFTRFLALADGTSARVVLHDEIDDDTTRREDVWRRWWGFRCEYSTGRVYSAPVMLAPLLVGNLQGRVVWIGASAPVANVYTINDQPISNGGSGALGTY